MQDITLLIDIDTHQKVLISLIHKSPISSRFKVVIFEYAFGECNTLLYFTQNNIDIGTFENHINMAGVHKSP